MTLDADHIAPAIVIGRRVSRLRHAFGLTQKEASAIIGIARSTLASIETGHDLPGRSVLVLVAAAFRVPVESLVAA
jgi:transcriptional regulator with XRE-family HTH domain